MASIGIAPRLRPYYRITLRNDLGTRFALKTNHFDSSRRKLGAAEQFPKSWVSAQRIEIRMCFEA